MPRLRRLKQNYIFQDRQAAWPDDRNAAELPSARIDSPGLQPAHTAPHTESMDFVERCFVAIAVLGLVGLAAVVIWMWVT
jgi:hypothetical protein